MKTLLLVPLLALGLWAQGPPNCSQALTFTGVAPGPTINTINGAAAGCAGWRLTWSVTGFSAITIQLEGSQDNSTWVAFSGTSIVIEGVNPTMWTSGTTSNTIVVRASQPYVRVNITGKTGSGTVKTLILGYSGTSAQNDNGAGGGGAPFTWPIPGVAVSLGTSGPWVSSVVPQWDATLQNLLANEFTATSGFVAAPTAATGTITYNHDNLVFSNFPDATSGLQAAFISGGNTTIYDLVGATNSVPGGAGRVIPVASEINIGDIITTDIGLYGPSTSNPGFDFHIVTGPNNAWVPYAGTVGSMEWDSGNSPNNLNITYVPTGKIFQFGAGFNPSSPTVSGNDAAGLLQFGESQYAPVLFASLGSALTVNGQEVFCSDCQTTSSSNNTCASGGSGAQAFRINGVNRCFVNAGTGSVTTIASGTASLGTSTVNTGTCSSAIDGGTATGVLTTDTIIATANADPTGVTGYTPATTGTLYVWSYPTADHVNFKLCNNTSSNITPGSAVTLNWKVFR